MAAGASQANRSSDNCSLLHFAAQGGCLEVVRKLLSAGADVNAKDKEGLTPLHYAASADEDENHSECVLKLLLESGASVGAKDNCDRTPLHYAAVGDCLDHVHLLVAAGADKKARDNEGFTPYDYAIE